MEERRLETLFKVKVNELLMIQERGYDISSQKGILSFTLRDFINYVRRAMKEESKSVYEVLSAVYTSPSNESIYVYYSPVSDTSTGKSIVTELINTINDMRKDYSLSRAIIISVKGLSPEAEALLKRLPIYFVQSFTYKELSWNKTKHVLVDKHTLLTPVEVKELLAQNRGLSLEKMPLITDSDPQAKYLGAEPGQVIRIDRKVIYYPTSVDHSLVYRFVKSKDEVLGI